MGMAMVEEVLLENGQKKDEIYAIRYFCDRVVDILNTVEFLTGNRIANDVGCQEIAIDTSLENAVLVSLQQLMRNPAAKVATASGQSTKHVPSSLLQLVRQLEDVIAAFNNDQETTTKNAAAAEDQVHSIKLLIKSAWDGTMCQDELGRKIPLAYAIYCLTAKLEEISKYLLANLDGKWDYFKVQFRVDLERFQMVSEATFQQLVLDELDFSGFGTSHFRLFHLALVLIQHKLTEDQLVLSDQIYVLQQFCERIVVLIASLEMLTWFRIANNTKSGGVEPSLEATIPASLQKLVCKMEASDDRSVALNFACFANALIDAAFNGSMCKKKLGRKIPLDHVIERSAAYLLMAMKKHEQICSATMGYLPFEVSIIY